MTTISNRIARARKAKNLNQSELARLLLVTPQAVQNWESGKAQPRGLRIEALAKALDVSVEYLMTGGVDFGSMATAHKDPQPRKQLKDVFSATQAVGETIEKFNLNLKDSFADMDLLSKISDPTLLIAIFYIAAAAGENTLTPQEVEQLKIIADRIKDTPIEWNESQH